MTLKRSSVIEVLNLKSIDPGRHPRIGLRELPSVALCIISRSHDVFGGVGRESIVSKTFSKGSLSQKIAL